MVFYLHSEQPYLCSAYVVRVCTFFIMAVYLTGEIKQHVTTMTRTTTTATVKLTDRACQQASS